MHHLGVTACRWKLGLMLMIGRETLAVFGFPFLWWLCEELHY